MQIALALTRYGHALGRYQAAWRFAGPALRRAAGIAGVSAAWDIFRRDAGPGDVGPAHEEIVDSVGVTAAIDPRRDHVLLWLADRGAPAIAEAATLVARMVGSRVRFPQNDEALLDTARDTLAAPSSQPGAIGRVIAAHIDDDDLFAPLCTVVAVVDRLREDPSFVEMAGDAVRHPLPLGTISHYVPAEPGAAWALDLALLGRGSPFAGVPPPPGLISRVLFRGDVEPEDAAASLIAGATDALIQAFGRFAQLDPELARGQDTLSHLSRNARTRGAWLLVAALGSTTRTQLGRALGLSRAGSDIQARVLAAAGLATLSPGGGVTRRPSHPGDRIPVPLDDGPLGAATAHLEATMADIDRLLARTSS